jgi:hypothetical protein
VPRAVTVWAVELARGIDPDEVKGTLELSDAALLFTPLDEARPGLRIGLADVQKVRRLRGSPVLMVERTVSGDPRRTAFYFAQPPPLSALLGTAPERPTGLAVFRSPKRKARRDNVNYLGLTNREKKETLAEWVRAVREAIAKSSAAKD